MLTGVVAVLSVGPLQDKLLIDRCEIAAEPVHDLFVEYLFLPTELINHHDLEWCETNDDLVISSKAWPYLPWYVLSMFAEHHCVSFCGFQSWTRTMLHRKWHAGHLSRSIVLSCPIMSCLVFSCLVMSCRVLSCLVVSCPVLSCLVLSCPVLSCLVVSCHVLSCLVLSYLVLSCPVMYVLSCLVLSCLVLWCMSCPVFSCVVQSCLVQSYLVLSFLVLSCPVLSSPVLSCPVLYCLVLSCTVLSCLVQSCLALFFPVLSCFVLSCRVLSCLVVSCPVLSCLIMSCCVFSRRSRCGCRPAWPIRGSRPQTAGSRCQRWAGLRSVCLRMECELLALDRFSSRLDV